MHSWKLGKEKPCLKAGFFFVLLPVQYWTAIHMFVISREMVRDDVENFGNVSLEAKKCLKSLVLNDRFVHIFLTKLINCYKPVH